MSHSDCSGQYILAVDKIYSSNLEVIILDEISSVTRQKHIRDR